MIFLYDEVDEKRHTKNIIRKKAKKKCCVSVRPRVVTRVQWRMYVSVMAPRFASAMHVYYVYVCVVEI